MIGVENKIQSSVFILFTIKKKVSICKTTYQNMIIGIVRSIPLIFGIIYFLLFNYIKISYIVI